MTACQCIGGPAEVMESGDGYAKYTSSSGDSKSYYGSDAKK